MKRRLWNVLLALALVLSLTGSAFAAKPYIEISSPEEMAEALAPQAGALALREAKEPVRVLLLSEDADTFRGAKRVLHYADLGMFVLEFENDAEALAAVDYYGADRAWLDTPETGAAVLDDGGGTSDPDPDPTETPTPAVSYTARSWGAAEMGLEQFRNNAEASAHLKDRHVTIAVLDTGADMSVRVFARRPFSPDSYDFVHATPELTDVTSGSAAGHGTMVSTLLYDLLPENAEVMMLRVFDDSGSASRVRILTALEYALSHGANIINMSLGWEGADSSYTFLNDVLDRLQARGITVVCAAGNRGTDASTCYPASYETTISVSAVNSTLNFESFSNYGSSVDFAAPGSGLRLITIGNVLRVDRGTSFAAPHVTAVAADMLLCEDFSAAQLYQNLRANSEDLGYAGKDVNYGWGFPRLGSFVENAITHKLEGGYTSPLATRDTDGTRHYVCPICGKTFEETIPATHGEKHNPFIDVSADIYYAESVTWAVANGITTGTSNVGPLFSPGGSCTRAQMVTFLWRAAGCPQPESASSPFDDVQDPDAYYYRAVLWAVEQKITTGMTETTFAPSSTVTRAQTVTFLWRYAGEPEAQAENPFEDVDAADYFYAPVLWAVEQEITTGMDEAHFAPDNACTRGQIVTFLYRDLGQS